MSGFKVINHTADIGISVSGKTLKELFVNAAKGLVDISVRVKSRAQVSSRLAPPHGAAHSKGILVNAVDKEQLLVRWLQEVIFQMNVKQAVPTGFKIISLAEGTLEAQISYVPFDARIHEFRREVKAATYHGLSMKKSGGQFRAAVIFDI